MTSKISTIIFATIFTVSGFGLSAQSKSDLYILGATMGFASFKASFVLNAPNYSESVGTAWELIAPNLRDADKLVNSVNSRTPGFLDKGNLDEILKYYGSGGIAANNDDFKASKEFLTRYYNNIVTLREGFTAQLARKSASNGLVHSYVLGVNIAIAEGQATVGEAARQIVNTSLMNAKIEAQALGLDLTSINECINLINASTPIGEIYTKIVSLRSTFQNSL
jgi:hypothetical protein